MGALHRQLGRVVGLDVRECSYECTNKRLARRQGVNDQPNGRSKHDPRQSSHNRDPLEKKFFFFSFSLFLPLLFSPRLGSGNGGRDHRRGAGLAAARGRRGPTMPGSALPFPRDFRHPHQVTGRARRETGTPPARLARGTEKGGYSSH